MARPTWDEYFFPKLTREAVRERLGIADEEVMVLVSGVKALEVDLPICKALIGCRLSPIN